MKDKKRAGQELSHHESDLIERLRKHPEIMARVQKILEIAEDTARPLKTADQIEELLIEEMRKLGGATLQEGAAQTQERVGREVKDRDPSVLKRKKKTLKWWCVFGLVSVQEQIWCSPAKSYIRLLPERLGVSPRGKSRRLQRVLTDLGCEHSFARAAQSVREHYGFELGPSAVRVTTLAHAQRAGDRLQQQYEQPFRVLPAVGHEHLIAEADGTMICPVASGPRKGKRPRDWKEMRLVAAQAKNSTRTLYAATFGTVEETGRRWGHCARAAGWGGNSRIHALGDGADGIRLQSREVFQKQGHFLCDFYHVSEYLGAAAPTCRPARPDSWRRIQQKRLRRGAVENVIDALQPYLEPPGTDDEKAPVRNADRYLTNRRNCLDYPGALKLDLPIGSGMIESGHRHVLHARLKKSGRAWRSTHADMIGQLRVLRANNQWAALWN